MNYLAHAFLADGCDDLFRLGNLMADHIKGPPEKALVLLNGLSEPEQARVLAGIRYHRQCDQCVDSDPEVLALRELFQRDFRRYAGIVLDMAWDYQLARRWPDYHPQPLPEFARQQYRLFRQFHHQQPASMQRMAFYMSRDDWLSAYQDFSGIESALAGMSRRIRRDNRLGDAAVEIVRLEQELSSAFDPVLTRLQALPRL